MMSYGGEEVAHIKIYKQIIHVEEHIWNCDFFLRKQKCLYVKASSILEQYTTNATLDHCSGLFLAVLRRSCGARDQTQGSCMHFLSLNYLPGSGPKHFTRY